MEKETYVVIDTRNKKMKEIYKGTKWEKTWMISLSRIPGAIVRGHQLSIPYSEFQKRYGGNKKPGN